MGENSQVNTTPVTPQSNTPNASMQQAAPTAATVGAMNYAGFGPRFIAVIIDAIITGVIGFIIGLPVGMVGAAAGMDSQTLSGVGNMVGSLIGMVYAVYFIGAKGATPGKKMMKLRVVKEATNANPTFVDAFLREVVGKFLSALVLGLGYLWIIWDPKKQGWHDKVAGTVVVKTE